MRRLAVLLAVPVLLLALAGCASKAEAGQPVSATTSASPTGATVKQFASVVAQSKVELEQSSADLKPCSFPEGVQAITCGYVVHTATLRGQIAAKNLRAVGTPPTEITQLVADTLKVTDELGANDVTACGSGQQESAGCAGTLTRVGYYVERTLTTLAGWAPYSS